MTKQTTLSLLTWLLISVTALPILFYIIPVSAPPPPTTRRVPQDYPNIQAAINAAKTGDIILVSPGIYYENVVVNKGIKLTGVDKTTTIIDAKKIGDVVRVEVDAVPITGFTIRNGDNGIRVVSAIGSVNVTGNIIKNNRYGISLIGDIPTAPTEDNIINSNTFQNNSNVGISISFSLSNTISKNDISESAWGMKLSLTNTTTISNNLLTSNSYGVYLSRTTNNNLLSNTGIDNSYCIYTSYSDHTLIRDNKVNGSTYGIELYDSDSNTILYNNVSDNPSYSIYLVHSDTNSVTNNTMSRNDWGFYLYNASSNTIEGNTMESNTFGITTTISSSNKIYHNNFLNNVDQISRDIGSSNTWRTSTLPYQGNHWSDYNGLDNGAGGRVAGDGIGDTLIPHLGVDSYPLMNRWPIAQRDIAILAIYESTNTAYVGQIINFEVIVKNEGPISETFNVTLQNNVTLIEERTVTNLAPYTNTSLIFNWNTSTVPLGYYLFSATAEPVPTETDLTDNSKTDGTINLKEPLLGDINLDGTVNTDDLVLLNQAFGSTGGPPPSANWNSKADLNEDNIIDIQDLLLLGQNYG